MIPPLLTRVPIYFLLTTTTLRRFATATTNTASTMTSTEGDSSSQSGILEQQQQQHDPLSLPAPPTAEEKLHRLDMSTGSAEMKMDHLGPLVVGKDGSLGRIENWSEMTDAERRNTLRVLGKRNQMRREALKKKEEEETEDGEGEGKGKGEL